MRALALDVIIDPISWSTGRGDQALIVDATGRVMWGENVLALDLRHART